MFDTTKFEFETDGKALEALIRRAVAVLSTSLGTPLFSICSDGKKVFVLAANDEALLMAVCSDSVKGSGAFTFEAPDLSGIVKGRANMKFLFNGQQCEYSGFGKYAGKFNVGSVSKDRATALQHRIDESDSAISISKESLSTLKEHMTRTTVKDVYMNNPIISYAKVKDKKLAVFSKCSNHFAYSEVRLKIADLMLSMPSSHFSMIEQATDSEMAISVSHSTIRARSKDALLVLPFVQASEQQFNLVPQYLENLGKVRYTGEVDLAEVSKACSNLVALHTLNAKLEIVAKKKGLQFEFATAKGSATDTVVCKGSSDLDKLSIDPRVFSDCLRVAASLGAKTFSVYDRCVSFTGEGSYVVGARAS